MSLKATSVSAREAASRFGTKRQCHSCGSKFYDFNKVEVDCPRCGTRLDLTATYTEQPQEFLVVDEEEIRFARARADISEDDLDVSEDEELEAIDVEDDDLGGDGLGDEEGEVELGEEEGEAEAEPEE